MDPLAALIHLGGYGAYVWPAYGVAALVLLGLLWHTLAGLRANERLAARLQAAARPAEARAAPPDGAAPHGRARDGAPIG